MSEQKADVRSEKVQDLQDFANDKGINMSDQIAITNHFFKSGDKVFSELDSYDAAAILDGFEKKGYTYWLNKATGQTDITDAEQQGNGKRETADGHPPAQVPETSSGQAKGDSGAEDEGTEIIYVDDQPFEITPEKRKAFQFHEHEMKMGWLKFSLHLAMTLESDLFKVGGYSTQEEYAKYHLGETRQSMNRKARRGRRILSMFPNVTSMLHSDEYNQSLQNIAQISPTKFNELIKFDEDAFDLKQLAETGEATLPSGDTISIEEIRSQTAKEVGREMKKERQKLQRRIANLEEDKKTAEWERDHYRDQVETNEEYIKRAEELENMYGQTNANVKQAYTAIDKTKQMLREVESVFGPVDTLNWEDVPDTLIEEVKNVLQIIHRMQLSAMDRFPFLHDIEDLEAFPTWKVKDDNEESGIKNKEL